MLGGWRRQIGWWRPLLDVPVRKKDVVAVWRELLTRNSCVGRIPLQNIYHSVAERVQEQTG